MRYQFWKKYHKKSRVTAIYPDQGQNKIYPLLGLISEIGEVSGKLKKMIRDDKGVLTDARKRGISKELGDVLWYISAMCLECEFELSEIVRDSESITDDPMSICRELIETQVSMGIMAMNVNDCITENCQNLCDHKKPIRSCLKYIFFHTNNICKQLDLNIISIATENLENLLGRKSRGTLGGDGDNR